MIRKELSISYDEDHWTFHHCGFFNYQVKSPELFPNNNFIFGVLTSSAIRCMTYLYHQLMHSDKERGGERET